MLIYVKKTSIRKLRFGSPKRELQVFTNAVLNSQILNRKQLRNTCGQNLVKSNAGIFVLFGKLRKNVREERRDQNAGLVSK